jgi:hypothetical protein
MKIGMSWNPSQIKRLSNTSWIPSISVCIFVCLFVFAKQRFLNSAIVAMNTDATLKEFVGIVVLYAVRDLSGKYIISFSPEFPFNVNYVNFSY